MRTFVTAGLLVFSIACGAQIPVVGYLHTGSQATSGIYLEALKHGLRDHGLEVGSDIRLEARWANGNADKLPSAAAELVALKPAVIVASSTPAIRAVEQASSTVPIVMSPGRLVKNLAHPGGNLTGVTGMPVDISVKSLELIRTLVPKASRVGVLASFNPLHVEQMQALQEAAKALGIAIVPVTAPHASDIASAFGSFTRQKCQAVIVLIDTSRPQTIEFARKARIPAVYQVSVEAERGGLMSYGPDQTKLSRRAASYVARILKGARAGDLPVEQPTEFELVLNRSAAKAIGIKFPADLVLRADRVVQ
jgi:putative tryptophan/tyrosine transport system substrate-binding protein